MTMRPDGEVQCRDGKPHQAHRLDINEAGTWPEHVYCPGVKAPAFVRVQPQPDELRADPDDCEGNFCHSGLHHVQTAVDDFDSWPCPKYAAEAVAWYERNRPEAPPAAADTGQGEPLRYDGSCVNCGEVGGHSHLCWWWRHYGAARPSGGAA